MASGSDSFESTCVVPRLAAGTGQPLGPQSAFCLERPRALGALGHRAVDSGRLAWHCYGAFGVGSFFYYRPSRLGGAGFFGSRLVRLPFRACDGQSEKTAQGPAYHPRACEPGAGCCGSMAGVERVAISAVTVFQRRAGKFLSGRQFLVPETAHKVVVYKACGLHVSIQHGGAQKFKAQPFEFFADGI